MPPGDRSRRPPRGSTPAGYREQVLRRLRDRASAENVAADRLQRRVAFERLLARLVASGGGGSAGNASQWLLKGGFALELRYGWRHRPTRDIDLRASSTLGSALARLRTEVADGQAALAADHFSFELGEPGPEMQGAPGGSLRVPVVARLAGVELARFHVDLSSGDAVVGLADTLEGSDLLDFAGIPQLRFPGYSVPQQLAEKLHAYTLPRVGPNTRTKDLVDLVVIPMVEPIDGDALVASVAATFGVRGTHPVPQALPAPDPQWAQPFRALMAQVGQAPTTELDDGFILAARFWDPLLAAEGMPLRWDPVARRWSARASGQE